MSITFAVSDVEVPTTRKPTLDREATLAKLLHQPVEALWQGTGKLVRCSDANALVEAVQLAFIEHRPLTLSPDCVWLCLARGFADHVNINAEALRDRLVRHEGQLTLRVVRDDFRLGQPNPWPEVFAEFSDQIAGHVGKLRDLVVADFSTTGPVERAASEVVLMDAFQPYFEYEMMIGCGIPSITLLGTPDDWRSVRTRAANFAEFGLQWWTEPLRPILDEFVRAAEGEANRPWWRSMFRYESGSGFASLTGWLLTLFPYLEDDDGQLARSKVLAWAGLDPWEGAQTSQFPSTVSSAPVRVKDLLTGGTVDLRFTAGMFGVVEDERTGAISPETGWAVVHGTEAGKKWAWRPSEADVIEFGTES